LEKLWIGQDDAVEAWFLLPIDSDPPYPVIIYAHGNGELIDYWASEFQVVREWGIGVLLVEYPGYGRSSGRPKQSTITEVFASAHDYLIERQDVRSSAIVGYGRSLGGGAICQLAATRPLAALILESTFSSVADLARPMGVPRWLVRDHFDNVSVLREYGGPVLLLHGDRDRVIPVTHGERLHDEARQSTLHLMNCGHNDCPRPWGDIHEFLVTTAILASGRRGLPSN
jgi:pimeloyl-ACP methyl ester carboxylesterase